MKIYLQAGKQHTQTCYQDCLSALEYKLEVICMIKFNMLSILESFMIEHILLCNDQIVYSTVA